MGGAYINVNDTPEIHKSTIKGCILVVSNNYQSSAYEVSGCFYALQTVSDREAINNIQSGRVAGGLE